MCRSKRWMKIALTKGQFAMVNEEDYWLQVEFRWSAVWNRRSKTFYADRYESNKGKTTTVSMHRSIMGLKHGDGKQVDHDDHNGLNNRRYNLTVVTNRKNGENRRDQSPYGVGVHYEKRSKVNPYVARIYHLGRSIHIGQFKTREIARQARKDFKREKGIDC